MVESSLRDFTKNEVVLWTEAADQTITSCAHRLAIEGLSNSFLPSLPLQSQEADIDRVADSLNAITDAMGSTIGLFERAITGFLLEVGA